MKQLKPGQVCTINRHVYRCKTKTNPYCLPCAECEEANHNECVLEENGFRWPWTCTAVFGITNYPVLIK